MVGLGKAMEIGLYSHPLHSFSWQDRKTALDLAEDAECKALLEEAMNKVGRGRLTNATCHTNAAI